MPRISEEKYKRYRELNNLDLNKKLKEAINELDYNKIRSIIFDNELESIDDEIYGALFLNKYPRFPEFLLMLGDSSSSDVVNFLYNMFQVNFCVEKALEIVWVIFHA